MVTPNEASVMRDNIEVRVAARDIRPGEIMVIRPGERIALDGVVTAGTSTVNQAPITGESLPEAKMRDSPVYAGTLNEHGTLEVRATSTYEDNTLSRIVHMVEEAQGRKAPAQEFVDRFARYYTPIVLVIASGIAVLPALFGQPFGVGSEIGNRLRAPQQCAFYVDGTVLFAVHVPGNQHDLAVHQLQTRYAAGMDAAPGIEVGGFSRCGEFRPVGMAADDHDVALFVPLVIALFDLMALVPVFRRACGVLHTQDVQEFPDISDKKIRYSP
jgi:hypothetical protein